MLKKTLIGSAFAGLMVAAGVQAAPISLPGDSPLYVHIANFEQINPGAAPGTENAWGVVKLDEIRIGTVLTPNQDISSGNPVIWSSSTTQEITGIFYGLNALTGGSCSQPLCSQDGYLDLYWDEPGLSGGGTLHTNAQWGALTPGMRTGTDTFTGITDGTFLVRLMFASGVDANPLVTLSGSAGPNAQGFSGVANGYFNVDTTAPGAWTDVLNSDWFNTGFGTRDLRFKDSYDAFANWNGGTTAPIFGASSSDPVRAYTVPEPSVLFLSGLALLALGFARRRKV